ncbi:MAG TPA: DUF1819 family protein, partial [Bacteroidales bacterium]|nr:DUF1819 family protein [Bacteroidales bacterium]
RIVTLFAIAKTNLLFFEFLEEVYREKCKYGHLLLLVECCLVHIFPYRLLREIQRTKGLFWQSQIA